MSQAPSSDAYRDFSAGEEIFALGEEGGELFLIAEGEIEIFLPATGSEPERVVAMLGEDDFFGEMALLEGKPRTASARAKATSRLLPVDGSMFELIVRHDPSIALRIMRKLCGRLRGLEEELWRHGAAAPAQEEPPAPRSAIEPGGELAPDHRARLVAADGQQFDLRRDRLAVGRPDRSSGLLPDLDLSEIDQQRTVSRQHAELAFRDGGFWVNEVGSATNGTYVNTTRATADQPVRLSHGDQVAFGRVILRFEEAKGDS